MTVRPRSLLTLAASLILGLAGCADRPDWLQPTPMGSYTGSHAQPQATVQAAVQPAVQPASLPARIYVANESSNDVSVIDATTLPAGRDNFRPEPLDP